MNEGWRTMRTKKMLTDLSDEVLREMVEKRDDDWVAAREELAKRDREWGMR